MLKKLFWFFLFTFVLMVAVGAVFAVWGYYYISRDLPNFTRIEDYRPFAVTKVYADDGTIIAEFFDERRYPVKIADVPLTVRNAFLAAEDAGFYSHKGIDPASIIRAVLKNLRAGSMSQGGSTITQQVVKNLLLTPEKKLTRKVKEAILSYRLEQRFTKDEILELYLNQIYFGQQAYGIRAAAKVYFGKEVSELGLGEASLLAGLPKAPSRYSPIAHLDRAKRRQRYVLSQMVKAGFITESVSDDGYDQQLKFQSADIQHVYKAPYYVADVRREFAERWKDYNIDRDGLEIYTAVNLPATQIGEIALRRGLEEVDKRRGWRGAIGSGYAGNKEGFETAYAPRFIEGLKVGNIYPALVKEVSRLQGGIKVELADRSEWVKLKDVNWLKEYRTKDDKVEWVDPFDLIRVGDVIEVRLIEEVTEQPEPGSKKTRLVIDQTPEIEGALVLLDPHTGKVKVVIGGYDYSRSQFNRVSQSYRQPGSAFKPIVYLAAIDGYKYTPATIVHDSPQTFRVGDKLWSPGNFDEEFLGDITLRSALEKSRNLVSADITSRIGVDAVVQYAKRLGIQTTLGRNLSLALGSSEVTMLELVRSYGVFATEGVLVNSVFITKIVDRSGQVLYDYEAEKLQYAKQVINENSAFVMANMMKGVVDRGTATRVKALGRPCAGKTGTSNDQMDAWFIGYTPEWVSGIWVGFDLKRSIGDKETGGKVAAPIWLDFMRDFLQQNDAKEYEKLVEDGKQEAERLGVPFETPPPLEPLDFKVPEGVDPFWIDRNTGLLTDQTNPEAFYEYFIKGTEPVRSADQREPTSYLESPEL